MTGFASGKSPEHPYRQIRLCAAALTIVAASVGLAAAAEPGTNLQQLIGEALKNNPEIAAAAHEKDAAGHRISPAGALEDPMFEAGVINVPVQPLRLNSEDMTMKMLGISQRLPYPGKRGLREDVAAKDAESVAFGYRETVNRVVRDVKVAFYDLALVGRSIEVVERNRRLVEQLLRIAEGRYSVGQGAQADLLKAQTQLAKMGEELLRMRRERQTMEADLARAVGRGAQGAPSEPIRAAMPGLVSGPTPALPAIDDLREAALRERPQLLGLKALIDKGQKALDLARKDYYPDFDVRFQYGQRDKMPDGMPRTDLFSLTVAVNLPVWGKQKLDPKVAEAQAMREQAISTYEAQQNELIAKLRQQIALAEQSRESAKLYETGILPQARLAHDSALAAYRVNRVDFPMLLDSQMTVLNYEINYATAVVAFNKALAEIDQLTGRPVAGAPGARPTGDQP